MIKFTDKEIDYLKNEVKGTKDFISTEEFKKEYGSCEMDEEDTMLLERYSKDTEDWDNVNTDAKVNKDIETICWSICGMANFSLRHFDWQDVLDIMGSVIYADIYEKIGGEEW